MNITVDKATRLYLDFRKRALFPKSIPITYFDGIDNVGDLINPYLVPKIAGRAVHKARSNAFTHLRAVGSVLGSASRKSYIWGSGSIDGKPPLRALDEKKILALRGSKTADLLRTCGYSFGDVPLGDPALLMPRFYAGASGPKRHRVGVVPHFSDIRFFSPLGKIDLPEGATLIDVRCQPEEFIDQLVACETIVSSSLHGLILADAYGLPNVWIRLPNELLGGTYKFFDYYTTTEWSNPAWVEIADQKSMLELAGRLPEAAAVKKYRHSLDDLLSAFPMEVGR